MLRERCTIHQAVGLLVRGEPVILPTETVYGLTCDATSPQAVERLFALKGRDSRFPFALLVANLAEAERLTSHFPSKAKTLAKRFWPGPLTLVLPRGPAFPATVVHPGEPLGGLRVPDHPIAQAVLRRFGRPLAAPSANRSGDISPTTWEEARKPFEGLVTCALDGGECRLGFDSTVVSFEGEKASVLRLGALPLEELEKVIGKVDLPYESQRKGPRTRAFPKPLWIVQDLEELSGKNLARAGLLAWGVVPASYRRNLAVTCNLSARGDPSEAMPKFYRALRILLENPHVHCIFALLWPESGLGRSLNAKLQELGQTPNA
ncbi:L-threonylcarbamoyladenylate synthase [Candidatus Methylacidithermus pantelleriae]|nr:L-threonylcarbamoyladenylate synthase [Candidatus Methylacidithermus pantelleriae]